MAILIIICEEAILDKSIAKGNSLESNSASGIETILWRKGRRG
jgi:hypothetical protein